MRHVTKNMAWATAKPFIEERYTLRKVGWGKRITMVSVPTES